MHLILCSRLQFKEFKKKVVGTGNRQHLMQILILQILIVLLLVHYSCTHMARHELSSSERAELLAWLRGRISTKMGDKKKRLPRGVCAEAAQEFNVSVEQVTRLYSKYRKHGEAAAIMKHRDQCGRKPADIDLDKLKSIDFHKRGTVRSAAKQLGIPKSTLQNHITYGTFKILRSPVKPLLREDNKLQRIQYCLNKLIPNPVHGIATFVDDFNTIHVDEKWFFQTTVVRKVIGAPDEVVPHRQVQSKRFITKVMFMCAVARPRNDFDGKIGIWPFTTTERAQRNSRNHRRGDLITKPVNINQDVYREMLIDNVLPAILTKFPDMNATIVLQQDNAGPHIDAEDPNWVEAVEQTGWDIDLTFQPPNSPDLNVNDLGFFRAIQSISQEELPRNVDELVEIVTDAYNQYSAEKINNIWLSHQQAMQQTLMHNGCNKYKLTHMKKEKLLREGNLPTSLHISMDLFNQSRQFLLDHDYEL